MEFIAKMNKLGEKGQVVIPKEVRDLLGVGEKGHIEFIRKGDDIIVVGVKSTSIMDVFGSWKPKEELRNIDEIKNDVWGGGGKGTGLQ